MTHKDVLRLLHAEVAAKLKSAPEAIDIHAPFTELGLDSLELASYSGELEEVFKIHLDPAALWDHETIWKLALHITEKRGWELSLPDSEDEIDALLQALRENP